jgi:hypothetical protein
MRAISPTREWKIGNVGRDDFSIGTTFVLFFLSFEIGQTLFAIVLVSISLIVNDKPKIGSWLFGRGLIAVSAIVLGAVFKRSLGILIPEVYGYLPTMLLMLSAVLYCYFLFFSFFKLKQVK